jgi:hypothetical protein
MFCRHLSRERIGKTRGRERHCTNGLRSNRPIVRSRSAELACTWSRSGLKLGDVCPATVPSLAQMHWTDLRNPLFRRSVQSGWQALPAGRCSQSRLGAPGKERGRVAFFSASIGLPLNINVTSSVQTRAKSRSISGHRAAGEELLSCGFACSLALDHVALVSSLAGHIL